MQPQWTRYGVLHVNDSDWRRIVSCGTSADFNMAINFNLPAFFDLLMPLFSEERTKVNFGSPFRTGTKQTERKPTVETVEILGMVLWYVKSSARQNALCTTFGLLAPSVSIWLDYGLEIMLRVVRKRGGLFKVSWPTPSEMEESVQLLRRNGIYANVLSGVFGLVDGGRMPCADYYDMFLKNAFYEGWTCTEQIKNLFVFNFKGEIVHAAINFPGSWHDSNLASTSGLIYPKLSDEMTPSGYALIADSAFVANNKVGGGKMVRGRKVGELPPFRISNDLVWINQVMEQVLPSQRQAAEWGIRGIKAPFGCLRLPLSTDAQKIYRLLRVCVVLYNLRIRAIGLSQIRTVFADPGTVVQPWLHEIFNKHKETPIETFECI